MGFGTLSAVDPGEGVQPSRGALPASVTHGDVRKCLAAKVAVGEGGPLIGISSRGEVGRDAITAGDAVGTR